MIRNIFNTEIFPNYSICTLIQKFSFFCKIIGDLQLENHTLKVECTNAAERHRQDMTNAAQIQELATMLQETHQSLVATNNHLLQELEETKHRHSQDLLQMNLNYEHLKKTVYHLQHV